MMMMMMMMMDKFPFHYLYLTLDYCNDSFYYHGTYQKVCVI